MKQSLSEQGKNVAALVVLFAIAFTVTVHILVQQGVRLPWEADTIQLRAEFSTAQGVSPGQGQTVRVRGVRIGDIADAELRDGRALLTFEIDPEYEGVVRRGATGLLRPRTGLKDMFVELDPGPRGAPVLGADDVIPVADTLPDVNFDETLEALDTDTREYFQLLLKGAAEGLDGNGETLREVFKRFEPTYRDLARVTKAVGQRRDELRRLVTSSRKVSEALAANDDDLAQLVDAASRSFGTLARRQDDLAASVRRLPGTLGQATDTLRAVEGMATELEPAARELLVVPPALRASNRALRPLALEAAPLLRDDIRPFVREAQPLVENLRAAAVRLAAAEPGLEATFEGLNHFVNLLGFNPNGREAPDVAGRQEGFLFHTAWGSHQLGGVFGWADAHGFGRKSVFGGRCSDIHGLTKANPLAEFGLGLSFILNEPRLCGGQR